jgi:nucleoid-associated protein YgaU
MAKRKKTKKTITKPKTSTKVAKASKEETLAAKQASSQSLFEQLKLSESYVSLALGAVVVFVVFIVIIIFIRQGDLKNSTLPAQKTIKTTVTQQPKIYVLQEGEGLWDVAVKFYGDGFKWVAIAKANNLDEENADYIEPGTRLTIPSDK